MALRASSAAALAGLALAAGCSRGSNGVQPAAAPDARAAASVRVRGAACSDVYYERPGAPRLLIVSDLPMQGPDRAFTGQMTQAIKVVLKYGYGFRAGRFTVGYQMCDDSSAAAEGWDPARCRRNAVAYARASRLAGVVGPLDSGCARIELPIANGAASGPLVLVSPGATAVGLTRAGPGARPGEPSRLFPSGLRSFARLVPPDTAQGVAAAVLARKLGARRVHVVLGQGAYADAVAAGFRAAAQPLGVTTAGISSWDDPPDRVARSRPDAVLLAGRVEAGGGGALVRRLRARLGTHAALLLPDGFLPLSALVGSAGDAADGAYLTGGVLPAAALGPSAGAFADEFRKRVGSEPGPYTLNAAQAAELLLAAIARSDGSRSSVARNLLAGEPARGPLAPLRIDGAGDALPARVVVYRIEAGRPVRTDVLRLPEVLTARGG